jgi:hypothetical protein
MGDILVRSEEGLERLLRPEEKIPVAKLLPAHLKGVGDLMPGEQVFEGLRDAMIQQDLHPARRAFDSFAANAKTSSTCLRVTPGNQTKKSSRLAPDPKLVNKAETGTRVPRKAGAPPSLSGSIHTEGQPDQSKIIDLS